MSKGKSPGTEVHPMDRWVDFYMNYNAGPRRAMRALLRELRKEWGLPPLKELEER